MPSYAWVVATTVLVTPLIVLPTPREPDSYYMLVFAQQPDRKQPQFSHTFATFVKGQAISRTILESHTISWLPVTLDVRLMARPEPGNNLDLQASLRLAQSANARISMWGPYQVQQELFARAVRQVRRLNSGAISYKALDGRFRPASATNCIHALSDIDMDNLRLETGTARGDEASYLVLRHLQRWIIEPGQAHSWVATSLDLGAHSIVRRQLDP